MINSKDNHIHTHTYTFEIILQRKKTFAFASAFFYLNDFCTQKSFTIMCRVYQWIDFFHSFYLFEKFEHVTRTRNLFHAISFECYHQYENNIWDWCRLFLLSYFVFIQNPEIHRRIGRHSVTEWVGKLQNSSTISTNIKSIKHILINLSTTLSAHLTLLGLRRYMLKSINMLNYDIWLNGAILVVYSCFCCCCFFLVHFIPFHYSYS